MKRFLLVLAALAIFIAPLQVLAVDLNLNYPKFGGLDLNKNQDLKSLATWVYSAVIILSGLAAFVMLIWGGVTWMSSAGSPGAISDAKGRIQNALLGLLLVLASFLILQVINPELTVLKIPGTPAPKAVSSGAPTAPTVTGVPPPPLDLKVQHPETNQYVDGPLIIEARKRPKTVLFRWVLQDKTMTQCMQKDQLPNIGDNGVISVPLSGNLVTLGDHKYTIRCENQQGSFVEDSVEDSVIITMVR